MFYKNYIHNKNNSKLRKAIYCYNEHLITEKRFAADTPFTFLEQFKNDDAKFEITKPFSFIHYTV
jgi:hypothetical protein